ncbi:DUF4238 domain-containing protein [Pseudomonas sp. NFACC46-3]|uniref:DUF4238 domain-containing protein n=1 Tax=Pseudomonas sp. NFACC46-3 TaxID=1566200 RepID=UPI0008EAEA3A|nr:DUF4238 domain-containing protein [Pseudomonas sp. NFACC46-3]SFL34362.1 Protein of unknown function [Pseudomonas sp. NFACC46-3]
MQLTIRQHYVPRVYLRAWTDSNGNLTVDGKAGGKRIHPKPEQICLEKYYYEDPAVPPTNELERKFCEYEGAFGRARDFLTFVEDNALKIGQPVAQTLASALMSLPDYLKALKEFAGTAYFRTPAALDQIRRELAEDNSAAAAKALESLTSPYFFGQQAFDSTLLDRFQNLHVALVHSPHCRLDTGDWPCFPLAGGTDHAGFAYDIGRHGAAVAVMTITPTLAAMFLPNISDKPAIIIPGEMPSTLAEQMNEMVFKFAERWVIRG